VGDYFAPAFKQGMTPAEGFDSLPVFSYNTPAHKTIRRNTMKLRPLHDWAVIRPSEAEERTSGGLYIPDTAKDKPHEGVVEAIGPGAYEQEKFGKKKKEGEERKFIPTTVKPGDRVLYQSYAAEVYIVENEERILVRERDILGILPERPARVPHEAAQESGSTSHAKAGGKTASEKVTKTIVKKAPASAKGTKTSAKKPGKKK
jgi:chaperonin GroES